MVFPMTTDEAIEKIRAKVSELIALLEQLVASGASDQDKEAVADMIKELIQRFHALRKSKA